MTEPSELERIITEQATGLSMTLDEETALNNANPYREQS